ncbi:MFS general substrate transporter [Lentinula aciculospora]|uniref:MFS general substrate transporter n=1 Tax=Lentinula aciculospora TaxID=153920 RepID=A0A9W8ZT52_9AGAR|nr:MFS general substrate transporter [Lentinula aciculospora]
MASINARALPMTRIHAANDHRLNTALYDGATELTELERPHELLTPPTKTYQAMLLLAGSMMIFHVIGINQVFGIFQEFYTLSRSNIKDAQGQDALVSLVGSIGAGLTWSGSVFMNPLIARIDNVKLVTFSGAFIMSLGLALASFATRIWHLYLTQALLYGLGSSMYYFPLMSLAPIYFERHRGFAMGIILAGSRVGGLVMALVLQSLLDHYGVEWALRILGIWNLTVAIPVSLVVRHRSGFGLGSSQSRRGSSRTSTMVSNALLKKGTFWYQSMGAFLQAAGNVVPLYYMSSYTVSVLSLSRSEGSLFVSINSGVNSLSRVAMGLLADYIGRQNTLIGGAILSAMSVFALWYDAPEARFIAFVVMYGVYAGGYNALLPTTITEIYGVENYTSVNGVMYFIRGLGSMFGAPIAGLILGSRSRSSASSSNAGLGMLRKRYNEVAVFDGMLLFAAAVCVGYVRLLDARDKGTWRWKA